MHAVSQPLTNGFHNPPPSENLSSTLGPRLTLHQSSARKLRSVFASYPQSVHCRGELQTLSNAEQDISQAGPAKGSSFKGNRGPLKQMGPGLGMKGQEEFEWSKI